MALINQGSAILLDSIFVRCVRPAAHQDHATVRPEPEIHSPLQARTPFLAHLQV